jgi:hypothetical protein
VSKPGNDGVGPERVKSPLARYLDEAFAGCDVWTIAPSRRRAAAGLIPPDWVNGDAPRPEPPAPIR